MNFVFYRFKGHYTTPYGSMAKALPYAQKFKAFTQAPIIQASVENTGSASGYINKRILSGIYISGI